MIRILAVFVTAVVCYGQTFTANLTGVVMDASGGGIPSAAVKIENTATRDTRETVTGAEGRFNFSQLLPGTYELTAEATGFKSHVQRGINLIAGQSAALNVSLQIGEITQRVEIGATATQVDTQTANQAVTLTQAQTTGMPNRPFRIDDPAGLNGSGTVVGPSVITRDLVHRFYNNIMQIGDGSNDLHYLLAWESLADREKKWATFQADPAWHSARSESEKDGPIIANIRSAFLQPTSFSAMK